MSDSFDPQAICVLASGTVVAMDYESIRTDDGVLTIRNLVGSIVFTAAPGEWRWAMVDCDPPTVEAVYREVKRTRRDTRRYATRVRR